MDKKALEEILVTSKQMSVLYIEDDKIAREATLLFLQSVFGRVSVCVDGEEGLLKYANESFDAIFTDINMPRISGIGLIKQIREQDIKTPILILSAHDDTEYFLESIKYGVDGYLLKPIELEQFFITISKVVSKVKLEKELALYHASLEEKVQEQTKELEYKYYHECNTHLFNAIKMHEDLDANRYDYMMLLDLSNFATINKEHGKRFADNVLARVSEVLKTHIHPKASLYKIESDRFVILLQNTSRETLHIYANQLISFFDTKNLQMGDEIELSITFNIGIASLQDDHTQTIINCEYALDKSKTLGSRHYEVFDENVSCYINERDTILWLKQTRDLVTGEKITPFYQPIQDIATGAILKYEVLARGIMDDQIIAPIYFLHSAEKLGYLTSITRMMINKSFEFFAKNSYTFSINITERDLLEGYLVSFLKEKLAYYAIDANRVTFEVLENVTVTKNSLRVAEQLNTLKDMGFSIAIDDFGIENSNFSRLLDIKLDIIKIDAVFIRGLKLSQKNRTITRAIVNLSKTLNIKTVAEFVEDEETYNIVKECGIDFAQGYYIGKPEAGLVS